MLNGLLSYLSTASVRPEASKALASDLHSSNNQVGAFLLRVVVMRSLLTLLRKSGF